MMIATDIQAIIPVGFYSGPEHPSSPDELHLQDGTSLLCRALAEVSNAGIAKALIVATDIALSPRWVAPAIQSCLLELATLGLAVPQIETLFLGRCGSMDDAIAYAMSCATAPWVAVVCPLLTPFNLTDFAHILQGALASDAPVIAVADTDWETALQLCTLTLAGDMARDVERYCPVEDVQTVFAGRAILPTMQIVDLRDDDPWACENAALIRHLIGKIDALRAHKLEGPIRDCRFLVQADALQISAKPTKHDTVLRRKLHLAEALHV